MQLTSSWMTPELESFRDAVRRFVQAEVAPHQQRWREQQHVDRALWRQAGARACCWPTSPRTMAARAAASPTRLWCSRS
jgi:alkylation response protein AidB-like acyl-CoA dehydrogenase